MEDKTEFPQEVLIYFFLQSENGINIHVFPTANSGPFYFLPWKRLSVMEEKHLRHLRSDGSIKGRALLDKKRSFSVSTKY